MDASSAATEGAMEIDDGSGRNASKYQWLLVDYTGSPPQHRSLHAGLVVGDCMYIFGGYDGTNRVNDFYRFSFKGHRWSQISTNGALPSPRDRHVTFSNEDRIYVFGGYDGNNRVNDFWQFDIQTELWTLIEGTQGNPPTPRHSHSGVEYDGSVYVFAGYDGNYRSDFHRFQLAAQKWSIVPVKGAVPKARYRTTAVGYRNRMLVVGGHDGAKHLNDFYQFNFDSLEWSSVDVLGQAPPPSPRDSHSSCICGDSLYLFGGSTGGAKNDLHSFSMKMGQWTEVGESGDRHGVPCPRFCHTAITYKQSLYIFGGYDGQQRLNDFWQLRLALEFSIVVPPGSLVDDLRGFLDKEQELSDVTFVVEGKPVHAHKLLCKRCPYFRAMFEGQMKESQQKTVAINNVPHRVFLALLEYLYTDEVDISLDIAMDLFVAADQFGVERLKRLCEQMILSSINVDTAATILQTANLHNAEGLRQHCMDYVLVNFDAVSKTHAFEAMGRSNVELVFEILKRR